MSRAHSEFIRLSQVGHRARYSVRTQDFGSDEELAQVEIDLGRGIFHVFPTEVWVREAMAPPHLYALDPESYQRVIRDLLPGYASGAWSAHIFSFFKRVKERGTFPDHDRGVT